MKEQTFFRTAPEQRLSHRIHYRAGLRALSHAPAHNLTAIRANAYRLHFSSSLDVRLLN